MERDFAESGATGDTIAAVATPDGVGGIAVVRVSGPRALDCVRSIFAGQAFVRGVESHRAYHGYVHDPADASDLIDEVVVLPMLAPHSYTAEDTVEISCHGGTQPARLIVDACVAAGARPAGPGEFTRRAFLNGRISLDQAEAVADLIHAETRLASAGALAQLGGGLRREIRELEEPLLGLLAELEGGLEFAAEEQAGVEVSRGRIAEILNGSLSRIESLLDLGPAGRRIREGVVVALMGEPNAGKSSLFNALLGRPRALVDAAPGTTRDVVDAAMIHRGVRFELHDTAGLRTASSRVESMGVELARDAAAAADIVLWLNDLSVNVKDINSMPEALSPLVSESTAIIPVGTKADLLSRDGSVSGGVSGNGLPVVTSAVTGLGVDELRDRILAAARADRMEQAAALGIVLNRRHRHRLAVARDELRSLSGLAADGAEDEVLSTMLGSALAGLGEISGRVFTENLLGEIFSRFCVGK